MLSDGGSRALVTRVVLVLNWDLDRDRDKEGDVGTVTGTYCVCTYLF